MKNFQYISSGILFAGLITLSLVVIKMNKGVSKPAFTATDTNLIQAIKVAYVDTDTIMAKYQYYNDLKEKLTTKQSDFEKKLNSRGIQVENMRMDAVNKIQKGLVTRAEAEQLEAKLIEQQQDLMKMRDEYMSNLAEEEQVMGRKVLNEISDYLKKNYEEAGYYLIIGKAFGGNVLYANPTIDLTYEVINGLNTAYEKSNSSK